jgi:hypothetical protein
MTVSKDTRLDNMKQALRVMLDRLAERPLYQEVFNPEDPAFAGIYNTSWKDLEDKSLLKGTHGMNFDYFQLTGIGWFCAMEIQGKFDTPEFQQRFGKLSAALKALVKGRHDQQITIIDGLCQSTGLPEHFVFNVIEGRVWKHKFNRVGPHFDESKTVIWIPLDFGVEPL